MSKMTTIKLSDEAWLKAKHESLDQGIDLAEYIENLILGKDADHNVRKIGVAKK